MLGRAPHTVLIIFMNSVAAGSDSRESIPLMRASDFWLSLTSLLPDGRSSNCHKRLKPAVSNMFPLLRGNT